MAMNWRKILGTGIDTVSLAGTVGLAAPIQGASYALTGKSIGSNITGESAADDLYATDESDKLTAFLQNQALKQQVQADMLKRELEQKGRPVMDAEVNRIQELVNKAQAMARTGMPEEAYNAQLQNINQIGQGTLSAAANRGSVLNSLGTIQGNQIGALRDLSAQDAMMQRQGQMSYLNTLQQLSGAEGRAEGWNELQPYIDKMNQYQALLGAANQNQYQSYYFPYQNAVQQQQMALDLLGAGASAGGQVAGAAIASDIRLKTNIVQTGTSPSGLPVYEFRYKSEPNKKFTGTMAQDLLKIGRNDAVVTMDNGFYAVNYSVLDVDFKAID